MKVAAYVPDLMDRSRFGQVPAEVQFVDTPDGLAHVDGADLVVADLSRPGALQALVGMSASRINTVGFVSHVDQEQMTAAKAAGISEVLPRSRFFRQIVAIVGAYSH